jgi:hypothetical protein
LIRLHPPRQVVFVISLILAIIAVLTFFVAIPYFPRHPLWLMTVAYVVLALGCLTATRGLLRLSRGNMLSLMAPTQVVFVISLILAIIALLNFFVVISHFLLLSLWLMTVAYVVLALGCFL